MLNFHTKPNWLKVFTISSLLVLGTSCSEDEIIKEQPLLLSSKASNSTKLSYDTLTVTEEEVNSPIKNIDDDSLETRWSGFGAAVNLDVDFGKEVIVDYLKIAFHKGDERAFKFSYLESNDGISWELKGAKNSSGITKGYEEFDLNNITARYLRIEFQGNTYNDWTSIEELEIYGTAEVIPDFVLKIEAEDYVDQSGIQTEKTLDIGGGLNVGYIDAEDSLSYAVNIPTTGEYIIDFRLASITNGSEFDIYQGTSKIGSVSDPKTGSWHNWETASVNVNMTAGNQILKLVATGSDWNINWLEIKRNSISYKSVPAKIEAEDFQYQSGIRIEATVDVGGGLNVGYIDYEDSISYTVKVPSSKEYVIDFRIASIGDGAEFDIYQGDLKIGNVSSPATGGFQNWETLSTNISLNSGNQTLKLVATGGNWNVNWFEIKEIGEDNNEDDEDDKDDEDDENIDEEPEVDFSGLDPNKAPAENFDLSQWKLTPSSGKDVSVSDLNDNFEISNQFYTASDGGMVFKNYPEGAGTTTNSTYSRVEFREMLDTSADDTSISKNNWVFSSSSSSNESKSGGVGGTLTATLAVNRVTKTSENDNQLGRIVIGQIHASKNEPIRLYYKKMPGDSKGAIYFVHEDSKGVEAAVNIIGDFAIEAKGDSAGDYTGASQPANGIALGEVFSYKIEVVGTMLYVDIYRDGYSDASGEYDMSNSGYANDWMYFKAGLYSQNKTVESASDYEQVTFYALANTHN